MKINNFLTLLKEDEKQKNWYLVIDGNAPTIEQYKRSPAQYNTIPHGLYKIEVELGNTWAADDGIRVAAKYGVKVSMNSRQTLHHIKEGSVDLVGNHLTIIGRFDKQGQVIFFRPGLE